MDIRDQAELLAWGDDRPEHRCSGCPQLGRLAGEERRPAGIGCELRGVLIEEPDRSFCAAHPEWSGPRPKRPVGPVVAFDPDQPAALRVVEPCPRARGADAYHAELLHGILGLPGRPLGLRDRLVVWQVLEYGDRSATVELDRIAGELEPRPAGTSWWEALLGFRTYELWDTDGWHHRFSLWGRLVLVLAGTLSVLVVLAGGAVVSLSLALVVGMLSFGLLVRLGRLVLGLLGVRFFEPTRAEPPRG